LFVQRHTISNLQQLASDIVIKELVQKIKNAKWSYLAHTEGSQKETITPTTSGGAQSTISVLRDKEFEIYCLPKAKHHLLPVW
jgi:hypothetical protein